MSPRSRGARRLAEALTQSSTRSSASHICRSCRATLGQPFFQSFRSASTATASAVVETPPVSQLSPSGPEISPVRQPHFAIKAGIVLSRPPIITPDPHPFETAYHLYQRRLNERLSLPFSQYFYFKKDTPAFEAWRSHRRARGGVAARDIGKYNAHNSESWNDEVLVGDDTGNPSKNIEQLIAEEGRAEEFTGTGDPKLAGLKRRTAADDNNDQRSLERSLSRTLYLLVKTKGTTANQDENELWHFPAGTLAPSEGLKEAAQRILFASCGVNMNTFFVGNHPVGHFIQTFSSPQEAGPAAVVSVMSKEPKKEAKLVDGEKTFFMKARILAGQAKLEAEQDPNIEDFRWVTKEEVETLVTPSYWRRVKNMLVAQ